jgi:hypothetical protein
MQMLETKVRMLRALNTLPQVASLTALPANIRKLLLADQEVMYCCTSQSSHIGFISFVI